MMGVYDPSTLFSGLYEVGRFSEVTGSSFQNVSNVFVHVYTKARANEPDCDISPAYPGVYPIIHMETDEEMKTLHVHLYVYMLNNLRRYVYTSQQAAEGKKKLAVLELGLEYIIELH